MLPDALELAEKGTFSGGMKRNRCILEPYARCARAPVARAVHWKPRARVCSSSRDLGGGLFFAVAPEHTRLVHEGFKAPGRALLGDRRGERRRLV